LDQLIIDNGKGVEGIDGEGARKREGISDGGKSLDKISLIAIIQE
jgi:phosphatidylserine synthase